jgi:hypothetical protein
VRRWLRWYIKVEGDVPAACLDWSPASRLLEAASKPLEAASKPLTTLTGSFVLHLNIISPKF